jgi:hypothetical protein
MKFFVYMVFGLIFFGCSIKQGAVFLYNPELDFIKKYAGNRYMNGRFTNGKHEEKPPVWEVVKWKLSRNPQRKEKKTDSFRLRGQPLQQQQMEQDFSLIWLGHASFLINVNGVRIITDPCFFNLPTSKRQIPIPIDIDSIKGIDYMLISHDHHDHFQRKSVLPVIKNNPDI